MKGRQPTKEEKQWMSNTCSQGCIVCYLEGYGYSPAMPHHIEGKTKEGAHKKTIPLCFLHHQGGKDSGFYVSRHPYKARFEARYGTEEELLTATRSRLDET